MIDGYFYPEPFLLSVKDKTSFFHEIDLRYVCFLVQKKGRLCFEALDNWYEMGDLENAKKAVTSVFDLLKNIYIKGYSHEDCVLYKNVGFEGQEAFFIDVGDFKPLTKEQKERGLKQFLIKKTGGLEEFLRDKQELYQFYKALVEKN